MSMDWEQTDRGFRLKYNGHDLEITRRRPDAIERRTFVVRINGKEDPVPLWNLPSAKTRALKAAMSNGGRPVKRLTKQKQQEIAEKMQEQEAMAEVVEAVREIAKPAEVLAEESGPKLREVHYTITGSFPLSKLGSGYNTLETAMEALRELGAVGCTVRTPQDIEL